MFMQQFKEILKPLYKVILCSYFNHNSTAASTLAVTTQVLNSNIQIYEHYANEIKSILEQSPELFIAGISYTFAASKYNH